MNDDLCISWVTGTRFKKFQTGPSNPSRFPVIQIVALWGHDIVACFLVLIVEAWIASASNFLFKLLKSSSLTKPSIVRFNAYAAPIFLLHSLLAESCATTETMQRGFQNKYKNADSRNLSMVQKKIIMILPQFEPVGDHTRCDSWPNCYSALSQLTNMLAYNITKKKKKVLQWKLLWTGHWVLLLNYSEQCH